MAIITYPLNNIDYQAEDAELFHCTRTSGIYASGHFPVSVTGLDNDITIGKGIGWIRNTEFSGKVFASKESITLNAGVPDASLPRIDAVVIQFDANANETNIIIKQGTTGSTPTAPEVERGEYIYELHLYHIQRKAGATAITPGDITDLRMDANYCGLMADSVTQVDMSAINAQVREFISDWENQIANVTDGKMIESPEYPGCYYRMNRGVKEWLNPPMMEDVEYPTTKRQDGKRVYTKLLKARSQAGSVALEDVERIVSVSAVAERDWNGEKLMFHLPVDFLPEDSPTIQKMQIYYRGNTIVFQSVVAKGMYNLYITVEYTKPGDEVAYTNVTADGDTVNVETNGDVSAQGDSLNVEMFTTISADGGAYIRRLIINGVAYDLAVGQAGSGAPGTAYPGIPGQFYTDLDSGEVYVCMGGSADAGVYIWRTIIPPTLSTSGVRLNHKTGIEFALIKAIQGAIVVSNGSKDAVIRGVAAPVNANDAANKQYVDSKIGSGSGSGQNAAQYHIAGKTVVFFGDSICEGAGDTGGYAKPIMEITGCISNNQGKSGATISNAGNSTYKIVNMVKEFSGTADMIVVEGGTNDCNQGVVLGEITEGYIAELDETTFCGALESTIQTLLTNYPQAQIFGVFTHRDVTDAYTNANGVTKKAFRDKAVAIYEKYAIPYYDAFGNSGLITAYTTATGTPAFFKVRADMYTYNGDKVHPNEAGYAKYYVPQIIDMLERHCPIDEISAGGDTGDTGGDTGDGVPVTINADMGIVGFIRAAGTISTAETGRRTDYISMEGVQSITVKVGGYSSTCAVAFFDSSKAFLADISVQNSQENGAQYGWIERTIDVTGSEYAGAKFFVISSYHNSVADDVYNGDNDFSYDRASYIKTV